MSSSMSKMLNKGKVTAQKKVMELNKDGIKVPVKMSITLMGNIIGYIINMDRRIVTYKSLNRIRKLFDLIDDDVFKNDNDKAHRDFIMSLLEYTITVRKGTMKWDELKLYITEEYQSDKYHNIVSAIDDYRNMTDQTMAYTIGAVEDRFNFIHLHAYEGAVRECFDKLNSGDYTNYRDINDEMRTLLAGLMTNMRNCDDDESNTFSLQSPDMISAALVDIVSKLRDKNRVLKSGNKRMNQMLSPGWRGGKLYLYCGTPNAGKTFTLVKALIDMKRHNPDIETKKVGKIPTAVLVTMEDTVYEVMPRIFSMICPELKNELDPEKDHKKTVAEIVETLKEQSELTLETKGDIDIVIKYFSNRAIDTADLYGIIEEIQDENREVVALLLDYVKRIKPAEYAEAEHIELKNVTNELRSLAIAYDIPVLTAAQLNKEALSKINDAKNNNKKHSAAQLGAHLVGNSFAMVENADCVIIINQEGADEDNIQHMSFKRVKLRYKDLDKVTYFTTRYDDNNDYLLDDIHLPKGEYVSKLMYDDENSPNKATSILTSIPPELEVSPGNVAGLMDMHPFERHAFNNLNQSK